jgi:hypothetical protein
MKKVAIPSLGETQAIPGRNVVIANARAPCRFQNRIRIFISHCRKFISQWNPSQTESERWLVMGIIAATAPR